MEALIDTNVVITYLTGRNVKDREACNRVMELCADETITGYLAFHSISNIWYILHKSEVRDKRRELLTEMVNILTVTGASREKVLEAIEWDQFNDFEDCLQYECAKEVDAEYIITGNVKDFAAETDIKVITPEEAVALCENKES